MAEIRAAAVDHIIAILLFLVVMAGLLVSALGHAAFGQQMAHEAFIAFCVYVQVKKE